MIALAAQRMQGYNSEESISEEEADGIFGFGDDVRDFEGVEFE